MQDIPTPRYDFYQTPQQLILAVYLKGYGSEGIKDQVEVLFERDRIIILLPSLASGHTDTDGTTETATKQRVTLSPLYGDIKPSESSSRVLSTKIELKLAKSEPINWPSLLRSDSNPPAADTTPSATLQSGQAGTGSGSGQSSHSAHHPSTTTASASTPASAPPPTKPRKNWDKFADEEDEVESKDPNAGGDAALQKLFSKIYADADPDTRKAMIKSYTESGGTSLSTDWSNVSKEKMKVQPPEGMYEMKM